MNSRLVETEEEDFFFDRLYEGYHEQALCVLKKHPEYIHLVNPDGQTALHLAAIYCHHSLLGHLLRMGMNPSKQDIDGRTPMHEAARWNHEEAMLILVEFGANFHTKDVNGITPLMEARKANRNLDLITAYYEI